MREVKQKESEGYSYDGVGASFELLDLRHLGQLREFFGVEAYEVNVSNDPARGTRSVAKLTLVIDGETVETQGAGNGPINALDMALRADLRRYAVFIDEMRLVDFKVRILNSGTEAVTRVTIESMDDAGRSWRTIGVNANIVVASLEALLDAVNYKLLRDGASAEPETGAS